MDQHRNSALRGAVDAGHDAAALMLLNQGAKPSRRNAAGDTALDIARRRGEVEIVKLLQSR